jgi:tight adherence protein B
MKHVLELLLAGSVMTEDTLYCCLGSSLVGLSVASLAMAGGDRYGPVLGWIERDLSEKLRHMRFSTRNLHSYLMAWLIVMGAVFAGFWLFLGNLIFAVILTAILLAAPWYIVRRLAANWRQKIEDQMADAMVALAGAIKAGLSLAQSLEILASQCPRPISAEFQQLIGEYKMGKPMERALVEAKQRLRSENFALFTAAMLASHESGGRLNETVERIAQSILELQRLERKVLSETAQARKSAVYMAIAPLLILTVYFFIDPVNTTLLFTTVPGQAILGLAFVFDVLAYLWARVILTPNM